MRCWFYLLCSPGFSLGLILLAGGSAVVAVNAPGVVFAAGEDLRREMPTVSFEDHKPGSFDELKTALGTWTRNSGVTTVDDQHAKTGANCLQLKGGETTRVTLKLAAGINTAGILSFHAERWTKRGPFTFRIESHSGRGWKQIFNGDNTIRVGRAFLSNVSVPLTADVQQLRFTVQSPPNTGILIDDIRIAQAVPQKIVSVDVVPFTLPALVGCDASPLVKLQIKTAGSVNPISLGKLQGKLSVNAADFESVSVHAGHSVFTKAKRIGQSQPANSDKPFVFSIDADSGRLADGDNIVWLAGQLRTNANIDHQVAAVLREVSFSNGDTVTLDAPPSPQRVGVALRQRNDDGVNTCLLYTSPSPRDQRGSRMPSSA